MEKNDLISASKPDKWGPLTKLCTNEQTSEEFNTEMAAFKPRAVLLLVRT